MRIDKCFFAVDLKYRGDWVLASYDPFSRIQEVRLYSLEGQFLQVAPRYERERGTHPFADAANPKATEETPLDHEYLKILEERHRQQQQHESQEGLDYHRAHQAHVLSLTQFTAKFARLLGRKGGTSGLSTRELELLGKVHRHHPRITALLLERAFERAEPKTIPVIVFHLQNLLSPERATVRHSGYSHRCLAKASLDSLDPLSIGKELSTCIKPTTVSRPSLSANAPAASLWIDERMKEGLARLAHLVEHATLGLVTGPTGVGKSALIKRFLHELPRQQCESVYCHLTHLKSTGMLKMIVSRLGEVPRRGKERLFEQIVEHAQRTESKLLLIMDEAHLLEGDASHGSAVAGEFRRRRGSSLEDPLGGPRNVAGHAQAIAASGVTESYSPALSRETADQRADGTLHRRANDARRGSPRRVRPLREGTDP